MKWLKAIFGKHKQAAEEQPSPFVPFENSSGRGLMDRATLAYLESTGPDPTQESLNALLQGVTRLRVINGGVAGEKVVGSELWLETSDPGALEAFRRCLLIVEDPETFGHCMCYGDVALELFAGAQRLAVIGLHHGRSIRWSAWKDDAELVDGTRLLDWLEQRGVSEPKQRYLEDQRRGDEYAEARQRWAAATPACLRPFQEAMDEITVDYAPLRQALETTYPDEAERVLVLFRWFGSGKGPWSGYPVYEQVPETLLLEYSTETLVRVLQDQTWDTTLLEGAARYFGGWHFPKQRPDDGALLPPDLKRRLLDHSLTSPFDDTIQRARKAFAEAS